VTPLPVPGGRAVTYANVVSDVVREVPMVAPSPTQPVVEFSASRIVCGQR
jgi:hypothetical protein